LLAASGKPPDSRPEITYRQAGLAAVTLVALPFLMNIFPASART
jgi:hypothetical protein